jgi:type IV fimbrial biogenesis protein FimT
MLRQSFDCSLVTAAARRRRGAMDGGGGETSGTLTPARALTTYTRSLSATQGRDVMRTGSGLTLIELLIVLTVAAIVAGAGLPWFASCLQRQRLRTATDTFLHSLKLARNEAVRRGAAVSVVNTDQSWALGWTVFVDANRNAQWDDGERILQRQQALPNSIAVRANTPVRRYIAYLPSGQTRLVSDAFQAGTLVFCSLAAPAPSISVIISRGGRARLQRGATGAGDCDCCAAGREGGRRIIAAPLPEPRAFAAGLYQRALPGRGPENRAGRRRAALQNAAGAIVFRCFLELRQPQFARQRKRNVFGDAGALHRRRRAQALQALDHLPDQDFRRRRAGGDADPMFAGQPARIDIRRRVDQMGGRAHARGQFPQAVGVGTVG